MVDRTRGCFGPVCPATVGVGQDVPLDAGKCDVGLHESGYFLKRAKGNRRKSGVELLRNEPGGSPEMRSLDRSCFAHGSRLRHPGHGGHQTARVLVLRIGQDLVCGARFDDLAFMQNRNTIANSGY